MRPCRKLQGWGRSGQVRGPEGGDRRGQGKESRKGRKMKAKQRNLEKVREEKQLRAADGAEGQEF